VIQAHDWDVVVACDAPASPVDVLSDPKERASQEGGGAADCGETARGRVEGMVEASD
jgi:molybdopterin-guanine dinucleotide biosynthesis protein A